MTNSERLIGWLFEDLGYMVVFIVIWCIFLKLILYYDRRKMIRDIKNKYRHLSSD